MGPAHLQMDRARHGRHPSPGGTRLPPEFRLWYAMFGAPAIPISLFWMGWTAYPHISIWPPPPRGGAVRLRRVVRVHLVLSVCH